MNTTHKNNLTNLQITIEDQIENNMLYATEIKNAILNKLPRNMEITEFKTKPYRDWSKHEKYQDDVSVHCSLTYESDDNSGELRFSVNCYNEDYSFDSIVDAHSYSIINPMG